MPKKETSSDKIKKLLTQIGGTEEQWKRTSKMKNPEGLWVREFENGQTGAKVRVTEKADGTFDIVTRDKAAQPDFTKAAAPDVEALYAKLPAILGKRFGGGPDGWKQIRRDTARTGQEVFEFAHPDAPYHLFVMHESGDRFAVKPVAAPQSGFALVSEGKAPAAPQISEEERLARRKKYEEQQRQEALRHAEIEKQLLSTPPVDADPAANKAADAIIERVLKCEGVDDDEDDGEGLDRHTLEKAGKALANRFGFGIGYNDDGYNGEDGEIYLAIAPLSDTSYDQHVGGYIDHLLPEGMGEESEAAYSYSGKMTLMELAEDLMRRGFVFDEELQGNMDSQQKNPLMPQLKALFDKVRAVTPPANKSGPDVPKL